MTHRSEFYLSRIALNAFPAGRWTLDTSGFQGVSAVTVPRVSYSLFFLYLPFTADGSIDTLSE